MKNPFFKIKFGGKASFASKNDVTKPDKGNATNKYIVSAFGINKYMNTSEISHADKIPHITDVENPKIFKMMPQHFFYSFNCIMGL